MSDEEEFGYLSSDGEEGGEFFGDEDDGDLLGEDAEIEGSGDPNAGADDKTRCSLCKSVVPEERMYTLDACGHRFCLFCISREIDDALKTSVTVCCPLKDCHTPLSVKDTMTLVKEAAGQRDALAFVTRAIERRDENTAGAGRGAASKKATQRIAARTYEMLPLYCEVAVVYLMFSTVLTFVQRWGEKKLAVYGGRRRAK